MTRRDEHKAYLDELSVSLESHLSGLGLSKKQFSVGETEFFFNYIIPQLAEFTAKHFSLTEGEFEKVFVMDSHEDYKKKMQPTLFAGGNGARLSKHPFLKDMNTSPEHQYNVWCGQTSKAPTTQHWPDFGLSIGDKVSVVFEAKYFNKKLPISAGASLAKALYEVFFYRGLPEVEDSMPTRTWREYDYGCAIIVDATENNEIVSAYSRLPEKVRNSFWGSADIYPVLLSV